MNRKVLNKLLRSGIKNQDEDEEAEASCNQCRCGIEPKVYHQVIDFFEKKRIYDDCLSSKNPYRTDQPNRYKQPSQMIDLSSSSLKRKQQRVESPMLVPQQQQLSTSKNRLRKRKKI
jgi:transcription initiation factor TFIIIB Brf1 subunit/transcription initiation factor TFIIB